MLTFGCFRLGQVPYTDALALQHRVRKAVLDGELPGALLLLTHPPTFTIGRHGHDSNVLVTTDRLQKAGAEVHRVDRGGDVTFHGPGQLVGYPIVNLTQLKLGVHDYVCGLSRALGRVAGHWGIDTHWDEKAPGLWVGRDKLAAFGVHVHRGITTHGFAINVTTNLDWYRLIVPCGLQDRGVTSFSQLLGEMTPHMSDIRDRVESALKKEFGVEFEYNFAEHVLANMHKETYL